MNDENDQLSRYRKHRCKLLRVLDAYRQGVYQSGMIVRSQHVNTTPDRIGELERRLAELETRIQDLARRRRSGRN